MTDNLPESPTSVTYQVTSSKGFDALVTIRDAEFKSLAEKMEFVEGWFEKQGYKPQEKRGFGKKEQTFVEGKKCPKCGGRLVMKVTKAGKPFNKCENGKWNALTNQNEGCQFVDWLDNNGQNNVL